MSPSNGRLSFAGTRRHSTSETRRNPFGPHSLLSPLPLPPNLKRAAQATGSARPPNCQPSQLATPLALAATLLPNGSAANASSRSSHLARSLDNYSAFVSGSRSGQIKGDPRNSGQEVASCHFAAPFAFSRSSACVSRRVRPQLKAKFTPWLSEINDVDMKIARPIGAETGRLRAHIARLLAALTLARPSRRLTDLSWIVNPTLQAIIRSCSGCCSSC